MIYTKITDFYNSTLKNVIFKEGLAFNPSNKYIITMENKRIKILYAITKSAYGGAGRYVLDLATSLPKENFDSAVVLGGKGILKDLLKEQGVRTVTLESLERDLNIKNDIDVYKKLSLIFGVEKPDIVHLNSSKMGGIGALAARMNGIKKIIFTAHGWPFNERRDPFSRIIIWTISWITALLSTDIIVIDEYDYSQAMRFPFCKDKIRLIHNGIKDFELLHKETARKLLAEKIRKDPFKNKITIGTIAELHKNKGLNYAIEAIAKLPPKMQKKINYFVIGEGEERDALQKLIKDKELEDRIFLAGFMEDAKKYLLAFDVFMLPSLKEGLPYVLLEAGFAGLPIITTRVGGIPDIIGETRSRFLIESRRVPELCRALQEMLDNKKIRTILSKKTKENVLAKFTFEKMFNQIVRLYKTNI